MGQGIPFVRNKAQLTIYWFYYGRHPFVPLTHVNRLDKLRAYAGGIYLLRRIVLLLLLVMASAVSFNAVLHEPSFRDWAWPMFSISTLLAGLMIFQLVLGDDNEIK